MIWYKMYLKDFRYNYLCRNIVCICGGKFSTLESFDKHLELNKDTIHRFYTWN